MAENKTKVTDADVYEFINNVPDERKRQDSMALIELMRDVTGEEPKMWGPTIVGFGRVHYKYASGREGDMPMTGFSPRKPSLVLYVLGGEERNEELMQKLGKYTTGSSCLYVKRLSDIDLNVLRELVKAAVDYLKQEYPANS